MNVLLVNTAHPRAPHISAVRTWRFGEALASLGHRVLLLCGDEPGVHGAPASALTIHDWRYPAILPCGPLAGPSKAVPGILKPQITRAATLALIVWRGGRQYAWAGRAFERLSSVSSAFHPDIVWATFGTLEALLVARRIAVARRAPWVVDVKDNFEIYVPRGLRRVMAHRLSGFTTLTANSKLMQQKSEQWLGRSAHLVYSGVDDSFFGTSDTTQVPTSAHVNVVGGLYRRDRLEQLVRGIADYAAATRSSLTLRYLGAEKSLFVDVATRCAPALALETPGYLPVEQLAAACRTAWLNCYVWHSANLHHKLLELLAAGRPVLAYPGESEESHALAARCGARLYCPSSEAEVAVALRSIATNPPRAPDRAALLEFTWPAQARVLDAVLREAIEIYRGRARSPLFA